VRFKYAAIPLALLAVALTPRRLFRLLLAAGLVGLAGYWNISALAHNVARVSADPARSQAYWEPTIRYLHEHLSPSFRVEAVDTADHEAAEFLPNAGIPIVRGWYRQNDFPQNELLYDKQLGAASYDRWLRGLGVRYVVLTDAPPDYSSRSEALLIRDARSRLVPVYRSPHVTVYELPHATSIVTGPGLATVLWLWPSRMVLAVDKPGRYRIALQWSPYWRSTQGCISRGHDGMVRLTALHAGLVDLSFKLSVHGGLEAIAGLSPHGSCRP
jgi:hypothetical protein